MSNTTRATGGRFAPGNRAALGRGRPTNEQRMRKAIEETLRNAGASAEDVDRLARAAGNPVQAALAIAVLCASVAERQEQVTPSPVDSPVHT